MSGPHPRPAGGGRLRRALAAISLGLAALLVLGYALTWVAALLGGTGHPPLAAVMWVGMIFGSLVLAPLGALLGSTAVWLDRRELGAASRLALTASGLHLALFLFALYFRLN